MSWAAPEIILSAEVTGIEASLTATVKEAVANVEVSEEKEIAETRPRLARSGTGEIRRSQYAYVEKRTADLRSRYHRIRRVVLLGATLGIQQDRRAPLQNQP